MAFVLRGEIDIEGRKGISTLRQVQGEAVKTTKAFEQGSRVNAHFAKMLLGINSQAAATHKALFLLARTGGTGLFGIAAVKAGIDFGETLMQVGQEAENAGKALDRSFKAGLKATTAEGVQSSIESITDQIEKLRAKTEGFSLRRMLGKGIEKLTGIDLGLTPEEGLIAAGEEQIKGLKKQLEIRKSIEEITKRETEATASIAIAQSKEEQKRKLAIAEAGEAAKAYRMMGSEESRSAEGSLSSAEGLLSRLKDQMAQLKAIKGIKEDDVSITKLSLDIRKQEVEVIKSQTQLLNAQRKEQGQILSGSKGGRMALAQAQKQKQRQDLQEAYKKEEVAVQNRLQKENAERKRQGLPELTPSGVRRIMAEEAVGLREMKAPTTLMPSATGEGGAGAGGLKAEVRPTSMAETMDKLLSEFKNLASAIQSAPLVTSGAGTA